MFEIKWIEVGLAGLLLTEEPLIFAENALALSIAKWEQIVAFYEEYPDDLIRCGGQLTCALCILNCRYCSPHCKGCPVASSTGYVLCETTPYGDYIDAIDDEDPEGAYLAAKAEVAFLKSLLPQ